MCDQLLAEIQLGVAQELFKFLAVGCSLAAICYIMRLYFEKDGA